jgi:uncharacterized membrane protein
MYNDKMKTKLATGLMILAMVVVAIGVVSALSNFDMQPPGFMEAGNRSKTCDQTCCSSISKR